MVRLALGLENGILMSGIEHRLVAIISAWVAGDLGRSIEKAHVGVGGHQGQGPSDSVWRNGVIVEIETKIDGLARMHGFDSIGGERMQSGRQQARLFLRQNIGDGAMIASGPTPLMGNLIAPQQSLAIAFRQRGEGAARPERITYITDGPFDPAFLIASPHLARARSEVIVRAQLNQSRMKLNLIAATFEHRAFEVVVQDHARLALPGIERMNMAAEEVLHGLIEEELRIQGSRVRQRHHEARQRPLGAIHHHMAEVSLFDLSLFAGEGLQLQERLVFLWTESCHGAAQLHDASGVATGANHNVDARGQQPWMLFEGLSNEPQIGIDKGTAQRLRTLESFTLDGVAHGIGMDL